MKVIAYLDQSEHKTITPYEARRKGIKTVYSTHKPGKRMAMYVSHKGKNYYFAYKSDAEYAGITAPETLTHTLCKEVIADIANKGIITKLKFFNPYGPYVGRKPVPIKLTKGILEHQIKVGDKRYSIDVYCEFEPSPITDDEQENSSSLRSLYYQWGGKIAFEIFHTHKVDKKKLNDLNSIDIPVFQIGINTDSMLYIDEDAVAQMDDLKANNYLQNHREKLARIFRKGIGGIVLNNPQSPAYQTAIKLHQQLDEQNHLLTKQETEINRLNDELNHKIDDVDTLSKNIADLKLQLDNSQKECATLQQKLNTLAYEKDKLEANCSQLNLENQQLKYVQSQRWWSKVRKFFSK